MMQESNLKGTLGKDINVGFLILTSKTKKYVEGFSSGNTRIDSYFAKTAINDPNTVTYIFYDKDRDTTIALASVNCSKIDFYDGIAYQSSMPAIEIKCFATNSQYHSLPYWDEEDKKYTLSKAIMSKLICELYTVSQGHVGASKIILNSVHKAITFYEDCYFKKYTPLMFDSSNYEVENLTPMYFNLLPDV